MKTYKELKQELENRDDLKESRLLRKGVSLVFARNAKKHGDDAERHFKSAQKHFGKGTFDSNVEELEVLRNGLDKLSQGLISLRLQSGSIVSIQITNTLLTENLLKIYKQQSPKAK